MKRLVAFLLLILLCTGVVDATVFTMARANSTTAWTAISSGDRVYRGDWVKFTPAGGTTWNWSFGDGFTSESNVPIHNFSYGKYPILMRDGYVHLTISLKTQDGVTTTKTINFTTLLPPIITQVATIATMNEIFADNYTHALTGDAPPQPGWAGFDWLLGIETSEQVYTERIGVPLFMMIIFSIPFIMNWIISKDFIVAGVVGGFLGLFIIARLPANMQLMAIGFIVMSVVAVVYSLMKDRE